MFRCPAVSSDIMDRSIAGNKKFGFKDSDGAWFYDYAYHNGYRDTGAINPAPFGNSLSSSFIIYGDQPGDYLDDFNKQPDGKEGNGYNHGDDGVVVLDSGLNTRFSSNTILAGFDSDNIYTVEDGTPADEHDTVLIRKN